MLQAVSIVELALIGGFCLWLMATRRYKDNLLQRMGLAGLAFYCALRIAINQERDSIELSDLVIYTSILLFGAGMLGKVLYWKRHDRRTMN